MSGTGVISTTSRRELSSSFFSPQGNAPKKIQEILTETLACFLPGRAKELSAPLVTQCHRVIAKEIHAILTETLACFLPVRAKDLSAPLYKAPRRATILETGKNNTHFQGKAPKEIHAILTETLAYFLPGRAKDLSAPL